jgi:hypothetical protein
MKRRWVAVVVLLTAETALREWMERVHTQRPDRAPVPVHCRPVHSPTSTPPAVTKQKNVGRPAMGIWAWRFAAQVQQKQAVGREQVVRSGWVFCFQNYTVEMLNGKNSTAFENIEK